ncbi:hypothetical protein Hanom_Chr01g00012891 [Helianthus anomalus]
MKMATKRKPQGPRFKRFAFWTKVAKVTKPQGPFWQFTLLVFCDRCYLPVGSKNFVPQSHEGSYT